MVVLLAPSEKLLAVLNCCASFYFSFLSIFPDKLFSLGCQGDIPRAIIEMQKAVVENVVNNLLRVI
jgi:amino acid permease